MTTKLATPAEPFFGPAAVRNETSSDSRILEMFGVVPNSAGVIVTDETAKSVTAVWGCVRLIAGVIAMMPVRIMRDENGATEDAPRDDLWWMLNEQPVEPWTATAMWEFIVQSMLLRGDGFVEILRRQGQRNSPDIVGLRPHHPDRVQVEENDAFGLIYRVKDRRGNARAVQPSEILHFPGFGFDGVRSPSAIRHYARRAITGALATDEFSQKFFGNGALQKHVIKSPAKMSPESAAALRDQWTQRYSGLDNAFASPIVLTEGLDIKELSLDAEDAQLIQSRQFSVIEVARAFGVPPVLIQETEKTSSWGSGVEQVIIGFVRFTIAPHLKRFRDELNRKLIRRSGRVIEFDTDELTRPDSKAFGELLRQLVGGSQGPGIISVNEARRALRRPPMPEGDMLYDPKSVAAPDPESDGDEDEEMMSDPMSDPMGDKADDRAER